MRGLWYGRGVSPLKNRAWESPIQRSHSCHTCHERTKLAESSSRAEDVVSRCATLE